MNCLKQFVAASLLAATALGGAAATFVGDRTDFRDETIYFAMTTRFYDGDPQNNVLCWDGQADQIKNNDPCWRGDFKGLIEKLDYIKALGFTAIWITPVVQNASGFDYHGYHAMDFSRVDLRYESRKAWGADEDVTFKSLIDAAHAKGIKIILDIVLQHTGNFGEDTLCHLFDRDQNIRNQADIEACLIPDQERLGGDSYWDLPNDGSKTQYSERFKYMKNTDGQNHDDKNYWHHVANAWNWDEPTRWWGQIAGDCVDLNTENPAVDEYLVKCYGEFIKMGVDGFRIDTTGHIAPLTFNAYFIPKFIELGEQYKAARKIEGQPDAPFYMFGECCARYGSVVYRDQHVLSSHYYTWKSDPSLVDEWNSYSADWWAQQSVPEGAPILGNMLTCAKDPATVHNSKNVFMQNGAWHEPDYSQASGFNVIDFPMHYNFNSAGEAVNIAKSGDHFYNDASWNVVYVDSHDYCPGPNDGTRFNGGTSQWAENLSLMFTFRGIPCIYYGSEVEFQKGVTIDKGPLLALKESGRAYFGEYLEGKVDASDFGEYTASGNVSKTLDADLAQHVRRLNQIRAAVPALRKGQYTFDGCSAKGGFAYKRAWKDSYALVALNGGATFSNVPAGTYTDIVTGKTYTVAARSGSITVDAPSNQGQLRVLVKGWTGGKVGEHGKFIYDTTPVNHGGSVTFTDPGTTHYYTKEDVVKRASMTFSPAGGSFRTETLDVTITLSENAKSGWYKVGNQSQVNLNPGQQKTVTIGGDMNYDETVSIAWNVTGEDNKTYDGTYSYKKVDPNKAITIYVTAPSAPNAYVWGSDASGKEVTPNGAWPGKTLTETTQIDGKTFWSFTCADLDSFNVIFNNGSAQTSDISGISEDTYFEYNGGTEYKKIDVSNPPVAAPSVAASPAGGTFTETVDVTLTAKNADSATYRIGSQSQKTFTTTATFTLGADMEPGESIDVTWTATKGNVTKDGKFTFTKKAETPVGDAMRLYVLSNEAPYLHAWGPYDITGNWPGVKLNEKESVGGRDYWVYTFPENVKTYNFILHNNSGAQTSDINGVTKKEAYYKWDGGSNWEELSNGQDDPTPPVTTPTGDNIVYFYNNSNWGEVYVYAWDGDTFHFGAWPGKKMTDTVEMNGVNYFWINLPDATSSTQIIFNNGGNGAQTADLQFHPGGCYSTAGWTSAGAVGAEEAEPEFYTLQGVRVQNPAKGIYIMRRGNRTSKVRIN
ncbi:MAG: starch-binding protein [Muribaculaceae bacterium]|nr:starch-binding protein [Muribaculaceae bacterium]